MKKIKQMEGFTLVEIVLILGILATFGGMVIMTVQNNHQNKKEETLKNDLSELRKALNNFYLDHHHYPCSADDFNQKGDVELLKKQLLWYTDITGNPSTTRSREFRFGPYLNDFPVEPITGTDNIIIDKTGALSLLELKKKVTQSTEARGGWYFQAETGFIVVNLNRRDYRKQYAYY